MTCDDILFLFLLPKLLFFEVYDVLDFFTFLDEPLMSLIIDLLQVLYVLLSFCLGMIVNFEWTLCSHKVRVRVIMVSVRNLLAR